MILAPLEGYTSSGVRLFFRKSGASIVFSEMTSSYSILHNKKTIKRLLFREEERPIGIQIFGNDSDIMKEAAIFIEDMFKPDFIDINMGCSVKKILKTNSGAALLKEPIKALKIVENIVKVVKTPITVKSRIGYDEPLKIDFFKSLKDIGVKFITIHGRLAKDNFSIPANWDYIFNIASSIKNVVGNGDIFSHDIANKILKMNLVENIMIGRGAIRDPYIFLKIKGGKIPKNKESYFLKFLIDKGEDFITIKKFSYHVFREKNGVREIREMINNAKDIQDILKICEIWDEKYDRTYKCLL